MALTKEQQSAVDMLKKDDVSFVKISACAGSGKTHLLVDATKQLKVKNGLYLAYNKAIATEAASKFPSAVSCMTIHSLAYRNTVKEFGLKIGIFNYRNIKERMPFENKILIADNMRKFFLSKYLKIADYCRSNGINGTTEEYMKKYTDLMKKGKIECTHDFYLKFYHMLLANKIVKYNEFDLVAMDESGDVTSVSLQIFLLLPAKKRLMVGDISQNIYQFNDTINGFKETEGNGHICFLTKSFRVHSDIAKHIEHFMQKYMDPSLQFKGTDYDDLEIGTRAFLSKTNSALISKIIYCIDKNIKFNTTRTADAIFELPLILISLKPEKIFVRSKEWRFLEDDARDYYFNPKLKEEYGSFLSYIASIHFMDVAIKSAVASISKYKATGIMKAYLHMKKHKNSKNNKLTISTAHSSKGLEFDEVEIADDMNTSMGKVEEKITQKGFDKLEPDDVQVINLYYVAVSRARKRLLNASMLYDDKIKNILESIHEDEEQKKEYYEKYKLEQEEDKLPW